MREGWEIKKLGELCKIQLGKTPYRKTDNFWDKDKVTSNVWLSIADMIHGKEIIDSKEYVSNIGAENINITPKGTLLVSFKLTLGCISFAGTDLRTNEAIASLIDLSELVSEKYMFYYFTFFDWNKATEGDVKVKGKTLNKKKLEAIHVIVPPLPEQKRIVSILNRAFEAIDKAKANAEQNLKNAKELFESYLQGVFEKKGDDWEEKTLADISIIKPPKNEVKKQLKEDDEVTFLPMADLMEFKKNVIPQKTKLLKRVYSGYTYFKENDILLAKITPCFENGKVGIAKNLKNGVGFGSSEYVVFRVSENVIPDFLYYFLSREKFREEGKKIMSGAVGHKRIQKEWIEEYIIPFPTSLKEQKKIVTKLDVLSAKTKKLEAVYQQKINDLDELKKSILQKAFAGAL